MNKEWRLHIKRLIIINIALFTLCLCGCGESNVVTSIEKVIDDLPHNIERTGTKYLFIYTDPDTKVEYIIFSNESGNGICPRYGSDGNIIGIDSED